MAREVTWVNPLTLRSGRSNTRFLPSSLPAPSSCPTANVNFLDDDDEDDETENFAAPTTAATVRSLARMARPSCSDAAILPTAAKRCCHTAERAAEESNDSGENNTFGKSSEEEEEGQSRVDCTARGSPVDDDDDVSDIMSLSRRQSREGTKERSLLVALGVLRFFPAV